MSVPAPKRKRSLTAPFLARSRVSAPPSAQPTKRRWRMGSMARPREPSQPLGQVCVTLRVARSITTVELFQRLAKARFPALSITSASGDGEEGRVGGHGRVGGGEAEDLDAVLIRLGDPDLVGGGDVAHVVRAA